MEHQNETAEMYQQSLFMASISIMLVDIYISIN